MSTPTYNSGFYAPARGGEPAYPSLWNKCESALCPSLGQTGLVLRDWGLRRTHGVLINMTADSAWNTVRPALTIAGGTRYINVPTIRGFSSIAQPGVTFTAWVRMASSGYAKLLDSNYPTGMIVYVATAGLAGGLQVGVGGKYPIASTPFLTVGKWHHVTVAYYESYVYLYIDGKLRSTQTRTGIADPVMTTFQIGGTGALETLNGQVDDIRLYSRKLADSEIAMLAKRPGIAFELRRSSLARSSGVTFRRSLSTRIGSRSLN